jgi:hypothetical protein
LGTFLVATTAAAFESLAITAADDGESPAAAAAAGVAMGPFAIAVAGTGASPIAIAAADVGGGLCGLPAIAAGTLLGPADDEEEDDAPAAAADASRALLEGEEVGVPAATALAALAPPLEGGIGRSVTIFFISAKTSRKGTKFPRGL